MSVHINQIIPEISKYMHTLRLILFILLSIAGICTQAQRKLQKRDTICLVQINDIYEIAP